MEETENTTYSGNQVKRAGKKLIEDEHDNDAMKILSYWRATHEMPLRKAFNIVEKYAKKLDKDVIMGKRLKRTPSIIRKLVRFKDKGSKLNTIQDIGGCRAIVYTMEQLRKLKQQLTEKEKFVVRNNYIESPKDDGYRSIHLKGKFLSGGFERTIELQLRTRIQHSWATAIEIVDLYTSQNIKLSDGEQIWKDFFRHTSNVFDYIEKCVDDSYNILSTSRPKLSKNNLKKLNKYSTPKMYDSMEQVRSLTKSLNVLEKFGAFTSSIQVHTNNIVENNIQNGYILIIIENKSDGRFSTKTKLFLNEEFNEAKDEYLKLEKNASSNKTIALIATNKITNIKEAYPNYFADSTVFLRLVSLICQISEEVNNVNIMKKRILEAESNYSIPFNIPKKNSVSNIPLAFQFITK